MTSRQKRANPSTGCPYLSEQIRMAFVRLVDAAGKDAVAATGGVSVKTVDRYLRGETVPSLTSGLMLMDEYGDVFGADILLSVGISGSPILGTSPPAETLREVVEGAAVLAAAWADLRIDHTEWPKVRRELLEARLCIDRFLRSEGGMREGHAA